jgi:tetratricopeptide (TPR) repeat protein
MNEKIATEINAQALFLLSEGKFFEAQTSFRQNVKRHPGSMTFNNMGVFYMDEGLNKPDGTCRSAGNLGILYLKKALESQGSKLTYCALGRSYFTMNDYNRKANDYQGALEYYKRASEMDADYATLFNCGVVLYTLSKFSESAEYFYKSLSLCNNIDQDNIFLAYSFALVYAASPEAYIVCREVASRNIDIWDKFVIAYLCGNFDLSRDYAEQMFEGYYPSLPEMAMLFDCLLKLEKCQEAEKYLELQISSLQDFAYNTEREDRELKKLFFDAKYRSKIIAKYKYKLSLLEQCCYFGCKIHGN